MKRLKGITKRKVLLACSFLVLLIFIITFTLTYGRMNEPILDYDNNKLNGIVDNVIHINDLDSDYYYYRGLNYTEKADGTLPTNTPQEIYSDERLVEVQLTYSGIDINSGYQGFVSLGEQQDTYIYYKILPINTNNTTDKSDDYLEIELIENPFTDRPTNSGFNGWVTDYSDAQIWQDSTYYIRYAKVPVSYTNNVANKVTIDFSASWTPAAVSLVNTGRTWATAFGTINATGMYQLNAYSSGDGAYDMSGYFMTILVARNASRVGYYNNTGVMYTSGTCTTQGGCTYYRLLNGENFIRTNTYYELIGTMTLVNNNSLPVPQIITYNNGFSATSNMATYFRQILVARYDSIVGFYNATGVIQTSGTCNTVGGCTYYELIQYYDNLDVEETIDTTKTYYYLATRDTNIIVMTTNLSNTWGASQTKPFTLTSVSNGTDYRGSVTWTTNLVVRAYNDTNIENIKMSTAQTRNTTTPPTGTSTTRTLYGNWENVRVGRGITVVGTYTNFATIMGGNNNTVGSVGTPVKYRLIVESGVYNTMAVTNGAIATATDYVEAKAIYGNDYDRVTNNNNNLEIYYCAAGSWGGNMYASTSNKLMFDLIVKSGEFGASKYDYTSGIYVGGRQGGTHYSPKRIKVEGGYIYNLLGGPLTASSRTNVNDAYINMTGGEVDVIIGGAGTTATYGHRIIQVTGGTVNYSVFGGSNGYQGTSTDGTVVGSSFVYIGGKANIGNATYVSGNQTIYGAEAGSVFGIGNGRTGYSSIGSSDNSNVMITEEAVIRRNVYGGGNFGATGIATSGASTTNITLNGGTIKGDVYGGGNNNGSGSATIASTINIYAYDGLVEGSLYGGSNVVGTIFGSVNLNLVEITVNGSVYGGGRGGYTNSSNPGTYVRNNINITVGDSTNSPTILNNIYGGSAFGSVNTTVQSAPLSNDGVNITYNNGEVVNLFGGGKGDATYAPQVAGAIAVTINGGTIGSTFGGNDYNGTVLKNSTIYLNGGTIANVYGGGNQVEANITTIFLQGSTTTTIYGGSNLSGNVDASNITTTSGSATTIYGGNNAGGKTLVTNININGGTINSIYGGGRLAETNETTINLTASTIASVYGGGEQANVTIASHINLIGSSVTTIYGGSNLSGNVFKSYITTTGGSATTIYGGNNAGGKTATTDIEINNGTISSLYGGGRLADSDTTLIDINGGAITNVYGGGENADIINTTTINMNGGIVTDIYGGSNTSGTVPTSNITIASGTLGTVYGGNNVGGSTTTTNVTINGGIITNVYGGGQEANTTNTTVTINKTFNEIAQVYGGGKAANVTNPNVIVRGGHIASLYGGSNQSGTVGTTDINIDNTTLGNNVTASVNYSAVDTESWQSTTYPTILTATITITNNTAYPINVWNAYLYIANSTLFSNYSSTLLTENNNMFTFNQVNRYSGINSIPANGSYSFEVAILTMQNKNNVNINLNVLGKDTNNTNYNISNSGIPNVGTIFGGNNNGGTTANTSLTIKDANIGNIYGGGNQAYVSGNTLVDVETSTISGSLYGGGNNGAIGGNSSAYVTTVDVGNSVYAGGNGSTAIVEGNTLLCMDGNTTVTNHVFGGGNAAATGIESSNNSTGIVNIAGGTIGGNVYGGANTSVLYGTTTVNIGYDIQGYSLLERNIDINGTVFGGGEANASGSENYDYSFISVTNGITININGDSAYALNIDGSIFGSGNASSTTGYSAIYLTKYGTLSNHKRNVSIQRANLVELNNSYIELDGATDRTNEYSTTLFTLSRIKELKLKNNSTIYLETGANLVEKVSSLVDISNVETKASVVIGTNGNITKNVDNRIYIKEGKNLNIATNESVTAYGEVIGMTFFGMFSRDRDDNVDEAFFAPEYDYGETVGIGEFYHFSSGSYVLGRHATNHNIEVDGFYTNEENENALNTINVVYINPTPEDSNYYMWVVGESISSYDISIAASKYSTLGTYELPLINFANPNTTFSIVGANFNELVSGFQLVRQDEIPRISVDGTADTKMSFVMKTSNTGWITVGETNFLTEEENPIYGTVDYLSENSTVVPSLLFYIYHSKNLQTSGSIGIMTISILAITPIDDLTNEVERININIDLSRVLYTTNDYEGSMTAGEEHDMFVNTLTDVTNKSKFSAYYSLYSESETNIYNNGDYRALVSSVVFPENTRFTMIDLTEPTPVYYYYVVTAADVIAANNEFSTHNEASYKFSKFMKMGSSSPGNNYDDAIKNNDYYDSTNNLAHEEFVFIVDLALTNIQSDVLNKTMLIELRNSGDQTRISVLGIQHANLTYNIYTNKEAVIELTASLSKNNIYIGEKINLNVTSNFVQQTVDSRVVQDTTYYYKKLGLKITIYDSNNNIVNGASLMGTTFKYNNVTYYPQMDGIVRINVAPRVANVSPKIEINTQYSNLSSGNYTIKVESFGSADGIYYGLVSSDTTTVSLGVLNNVYGLKSTLSDAAVIIDKETGNNSTGSNALVFTLEYSSGLTSPSIRVSAKRRLYNNVYSSEYALVDIKDYITNSYTLAGDPAKKEYAAITNPISTQTVFMYTKPNLVSGTYKIIFSIYDGNNYIGEVYNYVIIK